MSSLTVTAEQVRQELGAYLSKPLVLEGGSLSTQQELSATSLSTGGLNGNFIITNGGILMYQNGVLTHLIGYE